MSKRLSLFNIAMRRAITTVSVQNLVTFENERQRRIGVQQLSHCFMFCFVRAPAKKAIRAKKTKYVSLTTMPAVTFASVSKVSVLLFIFVLFLFVCFLQPF